jgi:hypothetical protein
MTTDAIARELRRAIEAGNFPLAEELSRRLAEQHASPYALLTRSEIRDLRELEPELYAGIQCAGAT